jgi:hypothetical protein
MMEHHSLDPYEAFEVLQHIRCAFMSHDHRSMDFDGLDWVQKQQKFDQPHLKQSHGLTHTMAAKI